MEIRVSIIENPMLNKTGQDAWDIWEEVLKLHGWRSAGLTFCGALFGRDKPFEDHSDDKTDVRVFDAVFTVQIVLKGNS